MKASFAIEWYPRCGQGCGGVEEVNVQLNGEVVATRASSEVRVWR